jgi:hypothetical protein
MFDIYSKLNSFAAAGLRSWPTKGTSTVWPGAHKLSQHLRWTWKSQAELMEYVGLVWQAIFCHNMSSWPWLYQIRPGLVWTIHFHPLLMGTQVGLDSTWFRLIPPRSGLSLLASVGNLWELTDICCQLPHAVSMGHPGTPWDTQAGDDGAVVLWEFGWSHRWSWNPLAAVCTHMRTIAHMYTAMKWYRYMCI